ncbi:MULTISPECIES: exonuclease domain-containing protein [unclassified Paenibacillus]|uniref:exonuclease domain-containing protein n=1 Tax=unclassified Paenibacillus TaxID=185978 RepID=UPI001C0FC70B|nr:MULTISPECIES: exonuclease domain-containing protein [unclassified Paenibacillus]MBU5441995.1 3'-5' exoribonuclease [Paenibacillus sp. MSJ-34]CAH0118208.1 DNA polymerase III PolC-type [Paenibacillus sp. CECT 9249]
MRTWGSASEIWKLYRKGGLTPAFASIFDLESAQQIAYIRSLMKDQARYNMDHVSLSELQAVVFDLETTGFAPQQGDEIISIGAVALYGDRCAENELFYSLVNPNRVIPPHVEQLTSITNELASQAPGLIEALGKFLDFVRNRVLIAHGSGHDKRFINAALWKTSRVMSQHRVLDTMIVASKLYPERQGSTLDDWLHYYGLDNAGRHHSLQDSLMTAKLWLALMDDVRSRQDVKTLGELYAFLGQE